MNLQDPNYDPAGFVEWVCEKLGCKTDAELARALNVYPPNICAWIKRKAPISIRVIVAIHEKTGIGTLEIKARMFKSAGDDASPEYVAQAA